ncbi:MAG: potassium channel family protein [Blastocatellia bacterium]
MKLEIHAFHSIAKALGRLFSLPIKWYAIAYFGLIPLFAFFYWLLPGEFYHANVAREPAVLEDQKRIGKQLEQEIVLALNARYDNNTATVDDWSVNSNSFSVRSLTTTGEDVSFLLDLKLTSPKQPPKYSIALTVTMPVKGVAGIASVGDLEMPLFKPVTVSIPDFPLRSDEQWGLRLVRVLFPAEDQALPGNELISSGKTHLRISRSLDRQIQSLAKGIKGDPSELSGHWSRMLYLSAVTITTLGYGDIAPLTDRTRALITAEAIAGIALIGLFLNRIAGVPVKKK